MRQHKEDTKRDPLREAPAGGVGARKEGRGEVGQAGDVCLGEWGTESGDGYQRLLDLRGE